MKKLKLKMKSEKWKVKSERLSPTTNKCSLQINIRCNRVSQRWKQEKEDISEVRWFNRNDMFIVEENTYALIRDLLFLVLRRTDPPGIWIPAFSRFLSGYYQGSFSFPQPLLLSYCRMEVLADRNSTYKEWMIAQFHKKHPDQEWQLQNDCKENRFHVFLRRNNGFHG